MSDVPKVKIELSPNTAVSILKFLSEFEHDFNQPMLQAFKKSYEEYADQVYKNITDEQLEDATLQTKINQMLGTDPPSTNFNQGIY